MKRINLSNIVSSTLAFALLFTMAGISHATDAFSLVITPSGAQALPAVQCSAMSFARANTGGTGSSSPTSQAQRQPMVEIVILTIPGQINPSIQTLAGHKLDAIVTRSTVGPDGRLQPYDKIDFKSASIRSYQSSNEERKPVYILTMGYSQAVQTSLTPVIHPLPNEIIINSDQIKIP
jgi:hypothetical protein